MSNQLIKSDARITALKQKLKTPWWSRLLGNWRAMRRARAARKQKRYIGTLTLWTRLRPTNQISPSWVHCYQDGTGKRYVDHVPGQLRNDPRGFNDYHHIIIPWLHGRLSNSELLEYASRAVNIPREWT